MDAIPLLESIDDEELYTTPFMEAIKESLTLLKETAFNFCFLPFVAQWVASLYYFTIFALVDDDEKRSMTDTQVWTRWTLWIITLVL